MPWPPIEWTLDDFVQCPYCEKSILHQELEQHRKVRHPDTLNPEYVRCQHCRVVLRTRAKYQHHLEKFHGEYKCSFCETIMPSQRKLSEHKILEHPEHFQRTVQQCPYCKKILKPIDPLADPTAVLDRHIKIKHPDTIPSRVAVRCEICGIYPKNAANLRRHIEASHGEYTCPVCGVTIEGNNGLRGHIKKKHRSRWNEINMEMHRQRVIIGERKYQDFIDGYDKQKEQERRIEEATALSSQGRFWKPERTAEQKGHTVPINLQAVRFLFPTGKDDK